MEKLAELRYKAYQDFYLRPGYVLKMMRRGGTYGRAAVKTSGAYLLRALHLKLSGNSLLFLTNAITAKTSTNTLSETVIGYKS